jgi:hypothetical protein
LRRLGQLGEFRHPLFGVQATKPPKNKRHCLISGLVFRAQGVNALDESFVDVELVLHMVPPVAPAVHVQLVEDGFFAFGENSVCP